ncbi:hypothetical protein GP486_007920, partial [Trichoglossum hirsutum]
IPPTPLPLRDRELLAIILGTPPGDGHEGRLVREGGADGADPVYALWQTILDCGLEVSFAVSGVVDALEEDEYLGIEAVAGG